MKKSVVLLSLLVAMVFQTRAAIAPEAVLPANTIAVATVPDMNAIRGSLKDVSMTKMWNDKAMEEFTEKFEGALSEKVFEPLLLFFDFDIEEYTSLVQGQVTFAVTYDPKKEIPAGVLIIDSGKKAKDLSAKLATLREMLKEEEQLQDVVKIGGAEFMRIQGPEAPAPIEGLYLGQSGSLLIGTTDLALARQIVAAQGGKSKKTLATHTNFAARKKAQLKGALAYGWLDFTAVMEIVETQIEANFNPEVEPGPLDPTPEKVINALGLKGLRSVSFSVHSDAQGELVELYLDVPKAARRGLFAMMAPPAKDASPPPFVTADTASFGRWRGDGAALWKQFEEMLTEITPLAAAMIGGGEGAIRANQPDFDFKKNLIGTLSDDFIIIDKGPQGGDLEHFVTPKSLYLIKSKKPAVTVKSIQQLIAGVDTEQEPEERKIGESMVYSYFIQAGGFQEIAMHLTSVGDYMVISLDEGALESFLNDGKKNTKKLADLPGLKAAAEKVGGFGSGMFAYENQVPMARTLFTFVKENPSILMDIFEQFGPGFDPAEGPQLDDWLDFKLLPDFKQVSKYFHFAVSGGEATGQGIRFRMYAPTPPALKK